MCDFLIKFNGNITSIVDFHVFRYALLPISSAWRTHMGIFVFYVKCAMTP